MKIQIKCINPTTIELSVVQDEVKVEDNALSKKVIPNQEVNVFKEELVYSEEQNTFHYVTPTKDEYKTWKTSPLCFATITNNINNFLLKHSSFTWNQAKTLCPHYSPSSVQHAIKLAVHKGLYIKLKQGLYTRPIMIKR